MKAVFIHNFIVSIQMKSEENSLYQYKRMVEKLFEVFAVSTGEPDVVVSVGDEGRHWSSCSR
jgi:hypothetical protein